MQIGAAHAWYDYMMAQIFKHTLWFHMTNNLLKEIEWKFSDTDKHTTMFLKIQTILQENNMADKHVQDFEKAVLEAEYKEYPLIMEFK